MATLPGESMRRVCRVLKFSRARLRARAVSAKVAPRLDEGLAGAFSVDGELSDIWRAFCNWANITHNGIFESPPPRQTGLFE